MNPPPTWTLPLLRSSLRHFRWHKLLPTTPWGDRLYSCLISLLYNGHWPRSSGGNLNDMMAFLKGSNEVSSPLRLKITDKGMAKEFIRDQLGESFCIPTFAVLKTAAEVMEYPFPDRCVIKPTHSSGQILVRYQGEPVDRQKIASWLRYNHYLKGRERNYRGVKPGIIVEALIDQAPLLEYKFQCLRGRPMEMQVTERPKPGSSRPPFMAYDMHGTPLFSGRIPSIEDPAVMTLWQSRFPPPHILQQMTNAAYRLTHSLLIARVDFFWTPQLLWVGEITTVTANGIMELPPEHRAIHNLVFFGPSGFNLADFPELAPGYKPS